MLAVSVEITQEFKTCFFYCGMRRYEVLKFTVMKILIKWWILLDGFLRRSKSFGQTCTSFSKEKWTGSFSWFLLKRKVLHIPSSYDEPLRKFLEQLLCIIFEFKKFSSFPVLPLQVFFFCFHHFNDASFEDLQLLFAFRPQTPNTKDNPEAWLCT